MYETPFHAIALEESGITSFKALTGKRVGIGPSGGPPEVFFRGLAEMLSVKATLVAGTPAELAQKLLASSPRAALGFKDGDKVRSCSRNSTSSSPSPWEGAQI